MANLRRKGGLGKDPDRAAARAAQLAAIDEDWNCTWPLDWQRHYRVLADLVDADGTLPDIQPGVQFQGDDLGRWLARQARDWTQLTAEQQERLTGLGVKPTQRPTPAPAAKRATKGMGKAQQAFQRAWRPSRSGWSGKALVGQSPAGAANRSPSTASRNR
jgi:hypothetical protein